MSDDDENENINHHDRFSGKPDEVDGYETLIARVGSSLEKILIGVIAFGLLIGALIFFLLWRQADAPEIVTVPTLAPTIEMAELAVVEELLTETLEPTVTSTPIPAGGRFLSPVENGRLGLKEQAIIELFITDPIGVRNVQILENGQTIFSQLFDGQTELTYAVQWVPLSNGPRQLTALMTNRAGEQVEVAGINVRVIDFAFMQDNAETFSRIQADVAAIRGLTFKEGIDPHLMGQTELKQYMRSFDYTPADGYEDMLVLSQFDFLERGYDLYEASVEFAGSSIAGFYDPATKAFVIVSIDRQIDTLEESTYAHELMHALQDQHFSLGDMSSGDVELTSEELLVLRAVAEGEAELLEEQYGEAHFTYEQLVDIFNISQKWYRPTQFTIEPVPVLSAQFYFPYEDGAAFVANAFERNGWAGVTDLWVNRPTSTEQILHPERYYSGDVPQVIDINPADDVLGNGWRLIRDDVMGEFYIRQYLGQGVS
ncbi:MAG: hypothetical protein ACI9EW_002767, partial [Cellvibrionaceae bacterium]